MRPLIKPLRYALFKSRTRLCTSGRIFKRLPYPDTFKADIDGLFHDGRNLAPRYSDSYKKTRDGKNREG
ncbi:hypothetical protein AGMMS50276_23670 [Synergistales bacterium]|nr:hypothetical protein AGMMS50276_23670 [Synergistales bacterium]